jgi:hypothetical protein
MYAPVMRRSAWSQSGWGVFTHDNNAIALLRVLQHLQQRVLCRLLPRWLVDKGRNDREEGFEKLVELGLVV